MKIYLLVKIIKSNLWLRRDPGDEAQRGQGVVGPTGPEDGFIKTWVEGYLWFIVQAKVSLKGWIIFKVVSKIEKISNLKCVERWNSGSDFFSERNDIFHSRIWFDFWIFFCLKLSTNQKDVWSASDWWFWHILTLSSKRSKGEKYLHLESESEPFTPSNFYWIEFKWIQPNAPTTDVM